MNWRSSTGFGIVATLVTGALFYLSIDMGSFGVLALVAPVPLLIYSLSAPRAWTVAVAAGVARSISLVGIIEVYGHILPVPAMLAMVTLYAAMFAIVILLTRWIARAASAFSAVFSYPLLLVTAEWLFGMVSPHGSFGAMGYALVDLLPLLQAASLGGLAALTFIVALIPMTAAVAIVVKMARPVESRRALIVGCIPVLCALGFGSARLSQGYDARARVALISLDSYEASAYASEAQDLEAAQAFAAQVRSSAAAHPDYIVLPEKQLGGARLASASSREIAQAAAVAATATVIAGFDERLADGSRVNSAQILTPDQPLRRYIKRHLIPGLELGYTKGNDSFIDGTRGVAICKDMDFPGTIRDYGRHRVELMLVPAWDFVADGRMHSRMALVRGVENGFAIARAAAAGRLTASDRYGRVIAEKITSRERPVILVTSLGLRGGGTLYGRIGDVFAWLCAASLLFLLLQRLRRGASQYPHDRMSSVLVLRAPAAHLAALAFRPRRLASNAEFSRAAHAIAAVFEVTVGAGAGFGMVAANQRQARSFFGQEPVIAAHRRRRAARGLQHDADRVPLRAGFP